VDEAVRGRLLYGLSSAKTPELAAAARELVLDPSLRDNEVLAPLSNALGDPERRDATWEWMKAHYDAIRARLPMHHGGVGLVAAGGVYCDDAHARDIEAFFQSKIADIEGGPRVLASTLEGVRLCVARRRAQEEGARTFFTRHP
jgi:alanyl aminopeptidase